MSALDLRGTGVAIVTPFHQDGSIDLPSLGKLIDHLVAGKVEYLVVMGTTGENVTIGKEEKQRIFSYVAEHAGGRVPLVAGIGGNHTLEVAEGLRKTDLSGYSAILSVSPYYNKPNQNGIFEHYRMVSDHAPLPVIMYNVPGRTGMNVSAETTLRIADAFPNIIATKEASGNFDQINRIIKYKPAHFNLISGDDGITLPMIACGAIGVISVVANAYPGAFSEMVRLCLENRYPEARVLHYGLTDIINTMFEEGSPSGVKAFLSEMGICGDAVRLPVYPVSEKLLARVREQIKGPGQPA
jgi:4-hydroxy-tetrahydrodipicolinate synthase